MWKLTLGPIWRLCWRLAYKTHKARTITAEKWTLDTLKNCENKKVIANFVNSDCLRDREQIDKPRVVLSAVSKQTLLGVWRNYSFLVSRKYSPRVYSIMRCQQHKTIQYDSAAHRTYATITPSGYHGIELSTIKRHDCRKFINKTVFAQEGIKVVTKNNGRVIDVRSQIFEIPFRKKTRWWTVL
jgi:hypothetical protein